MRANPIRRLLLSWFGHVRNPPFITLNVHVDVSRVMPYLGRLRELHGHPVTLTSFLMACLGRLYVEYPQANRRVVGSRLVQPPGVGVAAPVNLIGHKGEDRMEVSMMLVPNVHALSLVDVAKRSSRIVKEERGGRPQHPLTKLVVWLGAHMPQLLVDLGLALIAAVFRSRLLSRRMWDAVPVTTAITNPGVAMGDSPGMWLMGGSFMIPAWPVHLGSLMGMGPIQDRVVPVDGEPAVRPTLPIMYLFDHRLFDGVLGMRILARLSKMFLEPEAFFGEDGLKVQELAPS